MAFSASWMQRELADRLAALRSESGKSAGEVAEALGWERTKVQRIERAQTKVSQRDVTLIGEFFKVEPEEIAALCEMAVSSRTDIWWTNYRQWLSQSYEEFIGFENDARLAHTIQPALIPGLLQTREYGDGLYAGSVLIQDPDRVRGLLEVRRLRQRRLTEPDPLQLNVVMGEAALRTPYGGQAHFAQQLRHLREMIDLPNVSVKIVRLDAPVVFWPLEFFEFSRGGPAIVFIETMWGNSTHDDELEVGQARRVIARIEHDALPEPESTKFIEQRIKETARS
jgi:transcriptional regulator with XRE-family HTH domain